MKVIFRVELEGDYEPGELKEVMRAAMDVVDDFMGRGEDRRRRHFTPDDPLEGS